MSSGSIVKTLGVPELQEWLVSLGLLDISEEVGSERRGSGAGDGCDVGAIREKLRDGVVLCHLVNKIKPGSVDKIKPKRSSGDAEENILRFLQACTTMGVKKIFRPADLLGPSKDMAGVMVTMQLLYNRAVDQGLGLKVPVVAPPAVEVQGENGESPSGSDGLPDEEDREDTPIKVVKAVYQFSGTSEDELKFNKGDVIKVTKIVEGGWWEGSCNGMVGWFPSVYIEEMQEEEAGVAEDDDAHHYYKLVVLDILESERSFVQDLHDMLSTYLDPLKASSVLLPREVDQLTGNLPELTKRQQTILQQLEECAKLPVPKQNIGATFLDCKQDVETLYGMYCANHPTAVAVLTENSDKLSEFMESKGATSPGILTLTSGLSKPFRRLEKYSGLLVELHRQMEDHADAENVEAAITAYKAIATHAQEIRKKKEMEHEMLSNPVKGFRGNCLNELGECKCVVVANQALNAEEVEEVYFLVFPANFIILGVGQSLSGYEIKSNLSLSSVSVKKAQHSMEWPWPVEVQHKSEVVHASLASEADQRTLLDMVGKAGSKTPTTPRSPHVMSIIAGTKGLSRADSAQIFKTAYPTRRASVNIQRPHHWGFKSLRPAPPLTTQQLVALRERDKSPKAAKKFAYPNVKKKRASKHMEELLASAGSVKFPVENKAGDSAILKVVEAYCAGGRGAIHSDEPVTYISPSSRLKKSSSMDRHTPRPKIYSSADSSDSKKVSKSSTLPVHRSDASSSKMIFTRPPNPDLPGYPYRAPSPVNGSTEYSRQGGASPIVGGSKSVGSKRSIFRRRAESVDNYKIRNH